MIAPMRCLCCGVEFSYRGCVIGFPCDCDQGLDADCLRCLKCKKHCKCPQGPADMATIKAERLPSNQITKGRAKLIATSYLAGFVIATVVLVCSIFWSVLINGEMLYEETNRAVLLTEVSLSTISAAVSITAILVYLVKRWTNLLIY